VHIADSLIGLELEPLRSAGRVADLGSGAGLPGLVLAASRPEARFDLIESVSRKCDFLREAIRRMGLENAAVVCQRSEDWARGEGRESYDAVTARAVGRLAALAELASPLLRDGGFLVAWRGARSVQQEAELRRAAARLAMESVEVRPVTPYPGSRNRHIHLLRKNGRTPNGLPRRPGLAAKRPFGSE
jgi:16S rRNA (guanine527-N7)-methyltransferase